MADIFLSYASEDRERAKPLVEALEAEGWSIWWDREIHAGPRFDQVIEEQIANASCMIVVWSEASVKSDWVRDEANEGRERQILVPLLFHDVRPPMGFRAAQTANLVGWPEQRGELDMLLAGIRELVGAPEEAEPETPTPAAAPKTDPPCILVLPFTNLSDDRELEFLAEGLTGDVIGLGAHLAWKVVAGEPSDVDERPQAVGARRGVHYVLRGSLQRGGNRIRASVRLTETIEGQDIWAQRFDLPADDLLDAQEKMAHFIGNGWFGPVRQAESMRLRDVADEELDAYALSMRALTANTAVLWRPPTDHASAERQLSLLYRAVELDPNFGYAHAALATTLATRVLGQYSRDPESDATEALAHADRAVALAPNLQVVLGFASGVYLYLGNESLALHLAERQVEMLGYDTSQLYLALIAAGRSEEVIERAALPGNPELLHPSVSHACVIEGRYGEGLASIERALVENPHRSDWWFALGNVLGHLGRFKEAREAVAQAQKIAPRSSVARYERGKRIQWRNKDEIVNPRVDGLKKLDID